MIEELKESVQEEGLASITPQGGNAMTSIENAGLPIGNVLEQQETARNASEAQLIEYAKSPQPDIIPPYLVTAELMRRKSNREKQAKAPQFTVAQDVVQQAEQGIMAQMQQMAPKMPPGGFVPPSPQQALQRKPQMNSGIMGQMQRQAPMPREQITREQIMARGLPQLPNPGPARPTMTGMAEGGIVHFQEGGNRGLYFPNQRLTDNYSVSPYTTDFGKPLARQPYVNPREETYKKNQTISALKKEIETISSKPNTLENINLEKELTRQLKATKATPIKGGGYEQGDETLYSPIVDEKIDTIREVEIEEKVPPQGNGFSGLAGERPPNESDIPPGAMTKEEMLLRGYNTYNPAGFPVEPVKDYTISQYQKDLEEANEAFGIESSKDFFANQRKLIEADKEDIRREQQNDLNTNLMMTGLDIMETGNIAGGARRGVERYAMSAKDSRKMEKLVDKEIRAEGRMERAEQRGDARGFMKERKVRKDTQLAQVKMNLDSYGNYLKSQADQFGKRRKEWIDAVNSAEKIIKKDGSIAARYQGNEAGYKRDIYEAAMEIMQGKIPTIISAGSAGTLKERGPDINTRTEANYRKYSG